MNILELLRADKEQIIYRYYPNGSNNTGEVMYDYKSDKVSVSKPAKDDEDGYFSHKACKKILELVKKNSFPLKFTQAWY